MSFGKSIRLQIENLRTLAFGSISDTYAVLGAVFGNPIRIIKIYNGTNAELRFSDDGTNDKEVLPAGGFLLLDITTNRLDPAGSFYFGKGDQIYVRHLTGLAPTSGSVHLSSYYGKN